MSASIQAMRKAQEDRFFKLEQEKHIAAYIRKLKLSGRYDSLPVFVAKQVSASALPQVLAHSVRLSVPQAETHVLRQLDRSFMTRHVIKGVCTGDPYLVGSLTMGSRVSMGKNKWTAGTTASGLEPGTTIFSVHKASELMQHAPAHLDGVESRAARHMVDNTVVTIGGKRLKLLPDPTPGRAMAWGSTLAVWGSAALVVGGANLAGISTMADTRRVMHVWLTPLGDSIKDTVSPIKTWFANDDGTTKTRMNTVDTSFSKEVKRIFA